MIYVAVVMFLLAGACLVRSVQRDDSDAATAAGLFALAGCTLLGK